METQKQKIRKHLEAGGSITPLEALREFGCFRLAARIDNLRNEGMNIKMEMVEQHGKRFAKYEIKKYNNIQ